MSIRPTTRLGYREGIRPHRWRVREPYEVEGGDPDPTPGSTAEKFAYSREPRRYAGSKLGIDLTA